MPIKERRTKLLLLLFLTSDLNFSFTELTPEFMRIFDLTLNQKTKGSLSALLRDGYIEKESSGEDDNEDDNEDNNESKKSKYRITEKGFYLLSLEFPAFRFFKDEWDGVWRIISYEIPERKRHLRDRLRREMRGWGLGPWHRSFWMTAHPVIPALRDLVYGREEEQYIQSFESTHMFGDVQQMVEKVWSKSELEKQYKELFRVWHTVLSQEISKEDKFQQVLLAYIKQLKDDPGLPMNVVGNQWIGREAFDIYKEMRGILLAPASTPELRAQDQPEEQPQGQAQAQFQNQPEEQNQI